MFFCASSVGAFAEKVAVPESKVGLLGDALDFTRGAALGIPYTTAFRTLVQMYGEASDHSLFYSLKALDTSEFT